MKRTTLHIITYIFTILLLSQCEKYYVPEIETMPRSLVVEAMLTDEPGYFTVKLGRTTPFADRSYVYNERKAEIKLWSSEGESYYFKEYSAGVYRSTETVTTVPGRGYKLFIETSDGETYLSETQVMPEKTPIEQIVLTDSVYREVNYNYWGEPFVYDFDGIFFSVKPSVPNNTQSGFLYQWNSLVNYYVNSANLPIEYHYYCWKKLYSSSIYVYDYNEGLSGNQLILDDIHFLSYFNISPTPLDSSRFEGTVQSATAYSIYYLLKQFTINNDATGFWRSVKRQSEASGKLFDPVEEEISTNIYCESNPDLSAHGFFYTAATTSQIIAVKLSQGRFRSVYEVNFFPEPEESEHCLNQKSDFWINY
jgi:hypothetical protein